MYEDIKEQAQKAMIELLNNSYLKENDIIVVGCSTSEIVGEKIGKGSAPEVAEVIIEAIMPLLDEKNLFLAAQCCEHLNRALVIERKVAELKLYDEVCVIPQPKAGGSFATAAYKYFKDPVVVEHVKARAGLDIGNTMIGMHLYDVAVPVRLSVKYIGKAYLNAAYTRPKLIGGDRAVYE